MRYQKTNKIYQGLSYICYFTLLSCGVLCMCFMFGWCVNVLCCMFSIFIFCVNYLDFFVKLLLLTIVTATYLSLRSAPTIIIIITITIIIIMITERKLYIIFLFNLSDDIGKGGGPVLVALLVRIFGDRR